jgi:hypothetical protein
MLQALHSSAPPAPRSWRGATSPRQLHGSPSAAAPCPCKLTRSHPPALQGWAELEAFCGQRDVARALFQEGLQYNFPTGRYMRQWALFEKKAGRPEAAEELFARAVQLSPRDYKSWLQVGGWA